MRENVITLKEIQKILPQKYPFLLIDKVVDFIENESLVAIKNITGNEWAVNDCIGETDVFLETLMIEASIQAAIVLYHISKNYPGEKPIYLLGKVETNFLQSPKIGDQLILNVYADKLLRTGGFAHIEVLVEEQKIAIIQIFFSAQRKAC